MSKVAQMSPGSVLCFFCPIVLNSTLSFWVRTREVTPDAGGTIADRSGAAVGGLDISTSGVKKAQQSRFGLMPPSVPDNSLSSAARQIGS
jgi:hypothetical protein